MFQALARDRLERLNASPSSTPWIYFRVYSVLFLVLSVDMLWYFLNFLVYCQIFSFCTFYPFMNLNYKVHVSILVFLRSPYILFKISFIKSFYVWMIIWVKGYALSLQFCRIKLSLMTYNTIGSSVYLLLLFEPCSIAFETLQVLK